MPLMRLIITGSESFVGKELIKQCQAGGHEVIGIDAVVPEASTCTFVQGDIRDKNLRTTLPHGADAVVHLAALSRDQDCKGKMEETLAVNVMGTQNMYEVAKATGAKQFIFASSEWVYDGFPGGAERDEESPIDLAKLTSEYALSKLINEGTMRLEVLRGGPAATALRFGIIYGPRKANWAAVESLASKVKRGEPVEVGSLRTGRRFMHVSDIVAGILATVGRSGFEVFNLTADKVITLGDVIKTSEEIFGKVATVTETAPENINLRNPSNKKAKELLGWNPKISLADGLRTLEPFL